MQVGKFINIWINARIVKIHFTINFLSKFKKKKRSWIAEVSNTRQGLYSTWNSQPPAFEGEEETLWE